MKKIMLAVCGGLMASAAIAKPVKNVEQAVDLVKKSIVKNKLIDSKLECLWFDYDETDNNNAYYEIDIREHHTEQCGGDPETAPRLFSYKVDKKTGKLCTDSYVWAERLRAEDPTDFSCRAIK